MREFQPEKLIAVHQAADEVYDLLQDYSGMRLDEILGQRWCHAIAPLLSTALHSRRVENKPISGLGDASINFHMFLDLGEGWYADAAWQQFREVPSLLLPKVLVFDRKNAATVLATHGVDRSNHKFWLSVI